MILHNVIFISRSSDELKKPCISLPLSLSHSLYFFLLHTHTPILIHSVSHAHVPLVFLSIAHTNTFCLSLSLSLSYSFSLLLPYLFHSISSSLSLSKMENVKVLIVKIYPELPQISNGYDPFPFKLFSNAPLYSCTVSYLIPALVKKPFREDMYFVLFLGQCCLVGGVSGLVVLILIVLTSLAKI